jgi:hypothetical protein
VPQQGLAPWDGIRRLSLGPRSWKTASSGGGTSTGGLQNPNFLNGHEAVDWTVGDLPDDVQSQTICKLSECPHVCNLIINKAKIKEIQKGVCVIIEPCDLLEFAGQKNCGNFGGTVTIRRGFLRLGRTDSGRDSTRAEVSIRLVLDLPSKN